MFRNEEYVAESYNFESDEEAVLEEEENIIITALFQAIEDGNQSVLEDLFNAYAIDINKPNYQANNGELALHNACGLGNLKIVEILIENNAQINLGDTHGDTPVHYAARENHPAIIAYLFEKGADVNLQNITRESPVHLAARFGNVEAVKQLCKCGANINLVDEHNETALHVSAFFGFNEIVDVLGEVGIDTNLQNNDSETALHVSAVRGHFECVKSLLETGVNLNLLDKNCCTPLHLALRRHHTEIALLLIKYKCNVEIKDIKQQTALHLACSTNQKKVVDQLCKVNCNLNVQNVFNETPLHIACKSNNLKIIRRLIAAGCNLFLKDSMGNLPKDLIQQKQAYELEDNEEKQIKDEISKLLETLMDSQVKCKFIGMLKPALNYYDKNLIKDLIKTQNNLTSSINNQNLNRCTICHSIIDKIKKTAKCCNLNYNQCIQLNDNNLPCCNHLNGIEQTLSFKSATTIDQQQELNLIMISSIPKNLLKFNLKIFGDCCSGKSTLIETLKCGYLASWFRSTSTNNNRMTATTTNSSRSLNTTTNSSLNYSIHQNGNNLTNGNKSNGLINDNKTVLSSISTLISSKSKSSLDYSGSTPQSAINSINSSSILSINSDYQQSSTNSSNLNLNNTTTTDNSNGNYNNNHHYYENNYNHLNNLNNRKNSAINSDICNLRLLSKEFSLSDGLHPYYNKQDLNKFFTSFDLLDYSRFGLNNTQNSNHKLDCTNGINIQTISVPNIGELTCWEFGGHSNFIQIYNKFLNDKDDAFYFVCFNAFESFDRQFTSVCYWLDLISSIINFNSQSINFKGQLKRKINVLIIGTHRDMALKKNYNEINLKNLDNNIIQDLDNLNLRLTTNCLDNLNVLHQLLKHKYEQVFDLGDCIHLVDSRVANSNEIKLIKQQLDNYKYKFALSLQPITNFLEELIKKLNILRNESFNSPIISYDEFVSLIREQINLLVEDEYIEYCMLQLEKLGEILRLKNNHIDTQELIIYDLKWLASDIIGSLLNSTNLDNCNGSKLSGHYQVEDLQAQFPSIDALDLFLILENLEICTSCESEGNFLYLFPCFIKLGRPEFIWNNEQQTNENHSNSNSLTNNNNGKSEDDSQFNPNFTYIGIRIQCEDNSYPKHLIVCLFPRIQILFERCFQGSILQDALNELKLIHWCNGMKISYLDLEAIISLSFLSFSLEYDAIEIKVRSNKENREDCFRLFELLVNLIVQFINLSFPNLQLQYSYYSPFELNCKRKFLYRYSTEELANCLFKNRLSSSKNDLDNKKLNPLKEKIKNNNCDLNEYLCDIICCGIDDLENLKFDSDNFLVNTIKEFFELFLLNNSIIKKSLDIEKEECSLNGSKDETLNDDNNYEKKDDVLKPVLITEFTVHDLDILQRQYLCKLLDPPDKYGRDWVLLSILLNLTEKLPILDSKKKPITSLGIQTSYTSPTWSLLNEFSKEQNCTLQILLDKLNELNKKNAIEFLFKNLPLIKILANKNSKLRPILASDFVLE